MNKELSDFATRLREFILGRDAAPRRPVGAARRPYREPEFESLTLELFALQYKYNSAYREICKARKFKSEVVAHWTQIPAVPAAAFKELELTCIPPAERTAVFHSSGTTEQKPSRHFHSAESLAIYEASLWPWFARHVVPGLGSGVRGFGLCVLTPPLSEAPHSSLVHMFEMVRQSIGGANVPASRAEFVGKIAADGSWTLDFDAVLAALSPKSQTPEPRPYLLLGTAFSFVHLLDFLAEKELRFDLPAGSRVMETGGYKNRSRSMPKAELHTLITEHLGVPAENIVCEYGLSELSSQAYALGAPASSRRISASETTQVAGWKPALPGRFQFPSWARAQIISPETDCEVAEGGTGLIRVFDLANVFSVTAIQTQDLAIRRGDGFELIGRAALAEARGCSLMMNEPLAPPLCLPGGERVTEGRVRG